MRVRFGSQILAELAPRRLVFATNLPDNRCTCSQCSYRLLQQDSHSPVTIGVGDGLRGKLVKRTLFSILLLCFGATCASTRVLADDLLGPYVGAAIGESHVRAAKEIIGDADYDYQFDARHSAWAVTAGIRPISPLGVELDYIDFGDPSSGTIAGLGGLSQADAKAVTLFGLGYLPLPVPFLDIYGKLGIARSHLTTTEVSPIPFCPAGAPCPVCSGGPCHRTTFDISTWSTNFAYGAGVQGKMGSLAIRAEYERISIAGGNPDILSLGVTWNF